MAKSYANRTDPVTGSQKVLTYGWTDPVSSNVVKSELAAQYGHPAVLVPITVAAGLAATGSHPRDGDGVLDAADSTHATLDAAADPNGAPGWDITGLLICIMSGTAVGQIRQITAYNTSTKQATVTAWGTTPSAGDSYVLLVDLDCFSALLVKSEFSNATPGDCRIIPVLFSFPWNNPVAEAAAAPKRFPAFEQGLVVTTYTTGFSGTSMAAHAQLHAIDSRGAIGAKVLISKAPDVGNVALWAGGI